MQRGSACRGRTALKTLAAFLLWSSALGLPQRVFAHAGPQVREIYAESGDQLLLLSNRGLIFGSTTDGKWSLMCNEAMGVDTSEVPDLAFLPDGRIVAATSGGLKQTSDSGCNWTGVDPYGKTNCTSLAQDPTQPNRLFLATYGTGMSGIWQSDDGGATWQSLTMAQDTDFLRYVRIAPSAPEQMYTVNTNFADAQNYQYEVWHSIDSGKNWDHTTVDHADNETQLVLLGISPLDPSVLVAIAEQSDPSNNAERLLVSHDSGKTFESPMTARVISDVSFSDDGKTIWISSDDGLFHSADLGMTFEHVGTATNLSCVSQSEGKLLACGYYAGVTAGHPGIGQSTDGGQTFQRYMDLNEVKQPIQCDAMAETANTCKQLWIDWEREILGIIETPGSSTAMAGSGAAAGSGGTGITTTLPTAGTPAAGSGSAGQTAPATAGAAAPSATAGAAAPPQMPPMTANTNSSSCSCRIGARNQDASTAWTGIAALALTWAWRRRKRQG